ncbi:hypothetical protein ACOMHN_033791 [Nucella lapillus]
MALTMCATDVTFSPSRSPDHRFRKPAARYLVTILEVQQPASSSPPAAVVNHPLSAPTPRTSHTPQLANVPRGSFTPVQLFPSPAPPAPIYSMPRQAGTTNKTPGPIAPTTPGPVPATSPRSPPAKLSGPAPTAWQPQPVVTRAGRVVKPNPKYFD